MKEEEKKELMRMYDLFCKAADDVMAIWGDICEIKDGNCIRQREGGTCCMNRYPTKEYPHCPYLGKNGCTIQCLHCKLDYCGFIRRKYPVLSEIMRCLIYKAEEYFETIPYAVPREIFESRLEQYRKKGGRFG